MSAFDPVAWSAERLREFYKESHPSTWPTHVFTMMYSDDYRTALVGRLLFAQWEQRLAGYYLTRDDLPAHLRVVRGEQQRRVYRDMLCARLALDAYDRGVR